MTIEQLAEVNRAAKEFYTNEEIFQFIKDSIWTLEMFDLFISKIETEQRKMGRKY